MAATAGRARARASQTHRVEAHGSRLTNREVIVFPAVESVAMVKWPLVLNAHSNRIRSTPVVSVVP